MYRRNVSKFLEEMKGTYRLTELTNDKEKFINEVKHYIDTHPKGYQVEFNKDYTKIKKVNFEF